MNAEKALQELTEGNQRFTLNRTLSHNHLARMKETADQQHPFAVILTCSDSRIVPEYIFDQGIGDLFVIRVGGNIVDDAVLGSIEYAVEHLGVRLVMVLGHTDCGAVAAAVSEDKQPGHISLITDAIAPALEKAKQQPGDLILNTIILNTIMSASQIAESADISDTLSNTDQLKILPALYETATGNVKIIEM